MKVAIVRNTPAAKVIRRFGRQNREFYREEDILAVKRALTAGGHKVTILEGDCTMYRELEKFSRGSRPNKFMVFNLAYGVQGECRYTHIPSMLEQMGVPYVGSGPRTHTIALDKYVTKVFLTHAGLPTPECQLMTTRHDELYEHLTFPLVVKPVSESTSFALRVVDSIDELKAAVSYILDEYKQPALVEKFIDGTELYSGVIGNSPPVALPVIEIDFGKRKGTDKVNTYEVKHKRLTGHIYPPRVEESLLSKVKDMAIDAFKVVGAEDYARVDIRIDADGNPFILELNSMASLHRRASLWVAAKHAGMTYTEMINKILNAALKRYSDR